MNIVITGTSRGIGFQVAKLFAKDENNTVIAIARSEDLLKELKNECIRLNLKSQLKIIVFDIENPKNVKNNLKNEIHKHVQSIDILINNAGYLYRKAFIDTEIDEITKMFNVNIISHSVLIQDLIPMLKESKLSHVINISSMGGFQGSAKFPGLSFYSSSKAAVASLTECLAEEYKSDNIKFNCLALGAVNTEMLKSAFPEYDAPLSALEMAKFIHDFALNGSKCFNGKILPVSLSTP
ncbi:MAG: SDR family NAD(P)-dependent oxidoreductase [Bacteroidales bacterium]|jgi:3-oxoacyl-[acyl-carrier protein] reductase|nr:SDR family NAD(P)-dependent oxidoreductase [Bacteroidales bacterium]